MKEYTVLACACVVCSVAIDAFARTRLLRQPRFWFFLSLIAGFTFLVNGYLTGKNIVLYNPAFYLGLRIGSIPVEDFLFGFGMVTLTIVFWESARGEKRR
jgi:lycopene cyclase domain-containing protein